MRAGLAVRSAGTSRTADLVSSLATGWLVLVGVVVLISTMFGVVHYFSPIPFSDQWQGYIGFVHALADGNAAAWWTQHNEHRILFPRLLFWLDANLFGGRGVFLFVAGIVLQALTVILFVSRAARGRCAGSLVAIAGIALAFLFSWTQRENFTWAFQSQFFAVYLFALLSFAIFAGRFGDNRSRLIRRYGALMSAILATCSMGNGLFVFAALCFQSLILRRPLKDLAVLVAVGAAVAALYFTGYHDTEPGLPRVPLDGMVRLVPHFFLSFMGSATYILKPSFTISALFGIASLVVMVYLTVSLLLRNELTPYRSFLVTGYVFIVVTGMAVAHGRYLFGMPQAVVSRYATPMLTSWVCLFLLAIDSARREEVRRAVLVCAAVVATWTATYQRNVDNDTPELFQRDLAVLTMKIGIDHPELTPSIFFPELRPYLLKEAQYAADTNFGPYATGWLHDAGVVKFDPNQVDNSLCSGNWERLEHPPTGIYAEGWAVLKRPDQSEILILLVDASNSTIGYGVSGSPRPDVRAANGAPRNAGWVGFAKDHSVPTAVYAYEAGKFCRIPGTPR